MANGITEYTLAYIPVYFPKGQECCGNCGMLTQDAVRRPHCWCVGGVAISELKTRLWNCKALVEDPETGELRPINEVLV